MSQDDKAKPWRWQWTFRAPDDPLKANYLHDDAHDPVIDIDANGDLTIVSPLARELIILAPVMEAALRKVEWNATPINTAVVDRVCCPCCDAHRDRGHNGGCDLARILAALDAARAESK